MGAALKFLSPAAAVASAVFGKKKSKPQPVMPATPTIDDVEGAVGDMRRLRRRRGTGANLLMGQAGAEAGTGGGKQLTGE